MGHTTEDPIIRPCRSDPPACWRGRGQFAFLSAPSFSNTAGAKPRQGWGRGFESLRPLQSPPLQTLSAVSGPRKSPTAAGIRRLGLGVRYRNVTASGSPNAHLSPELESRPFYSTSFFASSFRALSPLQSRKIGIPFACAFHNRRIEPADLTSSRRYPAADSRTRSAASAERRSLILGLAPGLNG